MFRRIVSAIMLMILFAGMPSFAFKIETARALTLIVPDVYPTIQAALNAASSGDTVVVRAGTYVENVKITKDHLTIKSESGAQTTIVRAANLYDNTFTVMANFVNISGFTARGASYACGIYLSGAWECHILNNRISYNTCGIKLDYSYNNEIDGNMMQNNSDEAGNWLGVYLEHSAYNNITNNMPTSNGDFNIRISSSYNNVASGNIVSNGGIELSSTSCTIEDNVFSKGGITLDGDVEDWNSHVIRNNTVNGKPIYYYRDAADMTIPTDAGQVILANCTNFKIQNLVLSKVDVGIALGLSSRNTIYGNSISSCHQEGIEISKSAFNALINNNISSNDRLAIWLWYSNDNVVSRNNITSNGNTGIQLSRSGCQRNLISNNNITENSFGIYLDACSNNTVSRNILAANRQRGIVLSGSNGPCGNNVVSENQITGNGWGGIASYDAAYDNEIYLNNLWGNLHFGNGQSYGSTDIWSSPEEIDYVYHNESYRNYLGNYWSDYNGTDLSRGTFQNETGSDGIGDTPYVIDANNTDRYPLMNPWTPTPPTPDFSISASPTSVTIPQGGPWDGSTITVASTNGFNQPVQLDVSGLPSGVTPHWNPQQVTPPADGSITSQLIFSVEIEAMPGSYNLTVTGTSSTLVHDTYISLEITVNLPNYPPACVVKLQQGGVEISKIDVGQFFDIYVGGSTDDTGIIQVRFSSDDLQDGNPTGEWTGWYAWDISSGDWDASTEIRRWSFAAGGKKEVWAEVEDDVGQTNRDCANFLAHPGYAIIVAGQGELIKPGDKHAIDHAANNAYRVLRNLGFDDDHIYYLNSKVPQDVDGDGNDEVDSPALLYQFGGAMNEVKTKIAGNPVPPLILYLVGHGSRGKDYPDLYFFEFVPGGKGDEVPLSTPVLDIMLSGFPRETRKLIVIGSCHSGGFIATNSGSISASNRIVITAAHNDQIVGYPKMVRCSDRFWGNLNQGLNVKDSFTTNALPLLDSWFMWLDDNGDKKGHGPNDLKDDGELAAATKIGMPGTENLPLTPSIFIWKRSPGELRAFDSQNRTTGLVNGVVKEEIPDSMYDEEDDIVAIFSSYDAYHYEIVGTETGAYGLDVTSVEDGNATIFAAIDIPTSINAVHQYIIDWAALSQGGDGVTIQVDSDGDGMLEYDFTSDSELSRIEYVAATTQHDLGIAEITSSKSVTGEGYTLPINMTTINYGICTETFNVTFYVNTTLVASQIVTLASGNSTTITCPWNTTGFAKGNWTISAYAEPVLNETYVADNNATCIAPVHVGVPGDITGPTVGVYDGTTNMRDIQYLILLFNTNPSSPNWKPNADINDDGTVNMRDIQIAILNFNKHE